MPGQSVLPLPLQVDGVSTVLLYGLLATAGLSALAMGALLWFRHKTRSRRRRPRTV